MLFLFKCYPDNNLKFSCVSVPGVKLLTDLSDELKAKKKKKKV